MESQTGARIVLYSTVKEHVPRPHIIQPPNNANPETQTSRHSIWMGEQFPSGPRAKMACPFCHHISGSSTQARSSGRFVQTASLAVSLVVRTKCLCGELDQGNVTEPCVRGPEGVNATMYEGVAGRVMLSVRFSRWAER